RRRFVHAQPRPDPRRGGTPRIQRAAEELHAHPRGRRRGREPPASALVRVRGRGLAPDAGDLRADTERALHWRRTFPAFPRPAHAGRGSLRHLQLLGGGVPRPGRRHAARGARADGEAAPVRQRRGPVCRGDRPGHRRGPGQLPAGLYPRRPDQRCIDDRRARKRPRNTARAVARPGWTGAKSVNLPGVILAGFLATVVFTAIGAGSQQLKLTRMSIPYLLGTMFTRSYTRAKLVGFLVHLLNGQIFALLYVAIFQRLGGAGPWRGMMIGLAHAAVVLLVVVPLLPSLHPHMASERAGPTETRRLEPPGALALHYGATTPLW